jgi:hypothetical protein|tara:strand:- start:2774 stop:3133 length:360 start_codon:yes stop_codon:yes gene_type:complete
MIFDYLNDENFLLFASQHYQNPQGITYDDFLEDLKRFKYIKRLLKRYTKTGELKTHLILNHIIVLYNVFGDASTPMLFHKIDQQYWNILKSFLKYLSRLPEGLDDPYIDTYTLDELNLL